VSVVFNSSSAEHVVPSTFLSFTIDAGQLFEGVFWNYSSAINFDDEVLLNLTSALAPAVLRVSGTDADRLFYNMSINETNTRATPPPGFTYTLTKGRVSELFQFAQKANVEIAFGLNAGPGPRKGSSSNEWSADNAAELVRFSQENFSEVVTTWELGNEPNLYLANFRFVLTDRQLVSDLKTLRDMLKEHHPSARVVGPDLAVMHFLDLYSNPNPNTNTNTNTNTNHDPNPNPS